MPSLSFKVSHQVQSAFSINGRPSGWPWLTYKGSYPSRKLIVPPQAVIRYQWLLSWWWAHTSLWQSSLCPGMPTGLIVCRSLAVSPICFEFTCSFITWQLKDRFTPFIPDPWFLQSFCPLFRDVPWALGMNKGSCDVSIPFNFIVVYYFEIGSHCAAQNELDLVCGPHVSAYQGLGLQPHSHLSWKSWFFSSGLTRASYLCSLEQHNHLEFVNIGS